MIFHKSKAPSTLGVYMERITLRTEITMIKHNKKIRARNRIENRTPSKYRVEKRFNLMNRPFLPLKASTVPFPPKTP